uniref:60S ribosomal protein L7a n=1 Tax=Globodera pallida TaxID=36090 RepID=A0A183BX35_GLOPA
MVVPVVPEGATKKERRESFKKTQGAADRLNRAILKHYGVDSIEKLPCAQVLDFMEKFLGKFPLCIRNEATLKRKKGWSEAEFKRIKAQSAKAKSVIDKLVKAEKISKEDYDVVYPPPHTRSVYPSNAVGAYQFIRNTLAPLFRTFWPFNCCRGGALMTF